MKRSLSNQCVMVCLAVVATALFSSAHAKDGTDPQSEIEIGRAAALAYETAYPASKDKALQERVNRIGNALVKQLSPAMDPYEFTVVADATVNALAFPGGFLFLNEGLIRLFPDDNPLACVIGHEIIHVAHRHWANTTKKMSEVAVNPNVPTAGVNDPRADLANFVSQMAYLSYSRDDEKDADVSGMELAWQAGYDPKGNIAVDKYFETLEKGDDTPKYLRTHPPASDRLEYTIQKSTELSRRRRPPKQSNETESPEITLAKSVGKIEYFAIMSSAYMPLAVGNQWTYTVSAEGRETQYIVRVLAVVSHPRGNVYRAETVIGGKAVQYQLLTTADQLWRRNKPTDIESPWRLENVLSIGSTDPVVREGFTYVSVGDEEMTVPCGSFHAVHHIRRTGGVPSHTVDVWFAPGIGLIKRSCVESGVVETLADYRMTLQSEPVAQPNTIDKPVGATP